ncbi:NDP-sugar epimerase, includes UDP-GlcNAc-inverting 4,6-dehydratase FlaA1 and capsular polysaccharide biosynthesis protein EpsC [Jatrophihabitans endophyticus]|uniref:NDP-sugar epimerase, includes UDP-GlcNAc-inverting 4,6-dehydratase FlaA1 and capsular polysaccharide biosynthesis protein EpsC n=1 Tax=Jatrophihabitans endophyticus TaxID=1206085 RepID=A0A1M5IND6_9ACTN|nr:nucleoside-diphosphate sugar epimerase/dehydratase [Jatrophihabitans endophyticus]SHG29470.1 NDP-sugar epimerase, includes UDP-GlcNAc-inverting 4,6-dehydratase FlaA1 and capsular polysaccharide biosynthesis protein EpsC [Jatrophihabitans endophyticus]
MSVPSDARPRGDNAFGQSKSLISAILTDVVVWIVATDVAAIARYDFEPGTVPWRPVSVLSLFLAGGQLVLGAIGLIHRRRYVVGSFDEMRNVAVSATAVSAFAFTVVAALEPDGIPRSVPFFAWPLAVMGLAAVRVAKRLIIHASVKHDHDAEQVVIMGAGWVGSALAQRMRQDASSPFVPVAFVDDDPGKRHLQVHGVRVRGRFAELGEVAALTGATRAVVAVNDADATMLRRLSDIAAEAGVGLLVLPPLKDQLRGPQVRLSSLRELDVADVIGRQPVDTDVRAIAQYVTGRRVLVTGAGGSIGSELCRQLHRFGPEELVMLDRDESALHAVELSIHGRALLESPEIVLVDIRDRAAVADVFLEHQPQVVFHAAALKHLTLLERYPYEALKSNVEGTLNVLEAAAANGVEHFVNISTDKAANPSSALGHSKRLAERLTSWFASRHPGVRYISVRFGNVLGSRGSVLHAFAAQIEKGGPVTVTDPGVSRYFMTIPEACQLVIQAGAIGRGGEVLVLDMGEPVRIVDVASRMIAMSGKDVEIVFTGLRPGEKLHEELLADGEAEQRPFHRLISHVDVPALEPGRIAAEPWARLAASRGPAGENRRQMVR